MQQGGAAAVAAAGAVFCRQPASNRCSTRKINSPPKCVVDLFVLLFFLYPNCTHISRTKFYFRFSFFWIFGREKIYFKEILNFLYFFLFSLYFSLNFFVFLSGNLLYFFLVFFCISSCHFVVFLPDNFVFLPYLSR